jgi:hypothetical protein
MLARRAISEFWSNRLKATWLAKQAAQDGGPFEPRTAGLSG